MLAPVSGGGAMPVSAAMGMKRGKSQVSASSPLCLPFLWLGRVEGAYIRSVLPASSRVLGFNVNED